MPLLGTCTILNPCHALEQLGGKMGCAADPGGAIGERIRVRAGIANELAHGCGGQRRVQRQRIGAHCNVDHRAEVAGDVIGRRLVDDDRKGKAARRVEERIAVGGRGDHGPGPDDSGCARAVLDYEVLAPALAERLRQQAGHDVDAAPCRDRHDDAHEPIGIIGLREARIHQA